MPRKDPAKHLEYKKEWYQKNKYRFVQYTRKYNYGLSESEYQELLAKQNGVCALCHQEKKLGVDHCHTTGKVRGLLCQYCNTGVAWYERTKHNDITKYLT